jgi:hypothetical protein
MKVDIAFGPIHVQGNSVVDRLVSGYRFFVVPRFTGLPAKMREELPAYRAAAALINSLEEQEDAEGNGTFDSGVTCARGPPCCARCWASVLGHAG